MEHARPVVDGLLSLKSTSSRAFLASTSPNKASAAPSTLIGPRRVRHIVAPGCVAWGLQLITGTGPIPVMC